MNKCSIPILMYHCIAATTNKRLKNLFVSPERFNKHMSILHHLGYQGLSMRDLLPYLKGEKHGKVVGITFDDGYQNNLINAAPTLKKYRFGATCYLVSAKVGSYNQWDENKGIPRAALMTVDEVKQWLDDGLDIGSHTVNHVDLNRVDKTTAKLEIVQSKAMIEEIFNRDVVDFCYPYGKYSTEIESIVKKTYLTATTVKKGHCHCGDNLFELPRMHMTYRTGALSFLAKVLPFFKT
ncbi:MAG: hypothetical protein CR975_04195 [Gammaproteobacteria bacterium]|nr:MAG: hypothetical protein CR975_04195 [Gammaproteobacteria bacterium]